MTQELWDTEPGNTFAVDLRRRRTANGGWEWYFALGSKPVYHDDHRVGFFTAPDSPPEYAFRHLLQEWGTRR